VIEQVDQINIAVKIRMLLTELQQNALQLQVLGFCRVWYQTHEVERLLFRFGERSRFVHVWILKHFDSVF
jgi:hypothetical protein